MRLCNFCQKPLTHTFLDLHHQPPSNSFLTKEQLEEPEVAYPLKVYVCDSCWLVQVPESKSAAEIFKDEYPYYSSASPSNVAHAKEYVEMITERFNPWAVLEIGSNDGYMLWFFQRKGCIVQGVDPAEGPSKAALAKGVPTVTDFFTKDMATHPAIEGTYDLICGINVLAHQPDINDFVEGLKIALKPGGVITMEFPHLMRTAEGCQFDQIYLEHYSYFSFGTVYKIFQQHGLEIFDVEELPTHGGSLRVYAQHKGGPHSRTAYVADLISEEKIQGMLTLRYYEGFQVRAETIRDDLLKFLISKKRLALTVCAYGAAAKGNTLLNYCGIHSDLISYVVDISPAKQGKYLPGSHIPVVAEEHMANKRPDYVIILPWNIKEEIMQQLSYLKTSFVTAIPKLEVINEGRAEDVERLRRLQLFCKRLPRY